MQLELFPIQEEKKRKHFYYDVCQYQLPNVGDLIQIDTPIIDHKYCYMDYAMVLNINNGIYSVLMIYPKSEIFMKELKVELKDIMPKMCKMITKG